MSQINFKHLHYFWMVAKHGSIARASEILHLTPQTISGQLSLFEEVQGVALFRKQGRQLELTDAGQMVLSYAEEIFALGQELQEVLQQGLTQRHLPFRVGISDAVPKAVAYRLLEPALSLPQTLRLNCREGKLEPLLAELATHKLDIVLSDSPLPAQINIRGYSHFLGQSSLSFFARQDLLQRYPGDFPQCLNGAPFLLPGRDAAMRARLLQWFEQQNIQPQIMGEFDDSALMKAFGEAGVGFFAMPDVISDRVERDYQLLKVGHTEHLCEQFYAISAQRKLTHPAVLAISSETKQTSQV